MSSPNETLDPLESLECSVAFDSRDWGTARRDAWIYGIVFGWDSESMKEMEDKGHWGPDASKRLRKLHQNWKKLKRLTDSKAVTRVEDDTLAD